MNVHERGSNTAQHLFFVAVLIKRLRAWCVRVAAELEPTAAGHTRTEQLIEKCCEKCDFNAQPRPRALACLHLHLFSFARRA